MTAFGALATSSVVTTGISNGGNGKRSRVVVTELSVLRESSW